MELSRRETARSFHGNAVRAARKKGVYAHAALPEELDADLAVLAAISRAAEGRRTIWYTLAGLCAVAAVLVAKSMANLQDAMASLVLAIPPVGLLIVIGRYVSGWETRRIDLARARCSPGSPSRRAAR